ncbi:minichromosome maintenance protein 2, partial [Puccinia sorghi]
NKPTPTECPHHCRLRPRRTRDDKNDSGLVDELEQIQDLNAGRSNPNVAEEEEKGEGLSGDDMMEITLAPRNSISTMSPILMTILMFLTWTPKLARWQKLRWPDVTHEMPEVMAREVGRKGRSRAPAFLQSDSNMGEERKDFLTQDGDADIKMRSQKLRGIKSNSLKEWIDVPASQFLKYVEKTAHPAVFAIGQGASAVGLTAFDGALVLADKFTCLIDEFDKINDQNWLVNNHPSHLHFCTCNLNCVPNPCRHRNSIHEAIKQQIFSISKADIVVFKPDAPSLQLPILFEANIIRKSVRPSPPPPSEKKNLTEKSFFSFLAKLDEVNVQTSLDQDVNNPRKDIQYAREKVRPKLHQMDQDKMSKFLSELRRESLSTGLIPIPVQHLESMIRMSEASAKLHLYVRDENIDLAIQVAINSFIECQETSVKKQLQRSFRKYLHANNDHFELLAFLLGQLLKGKIRFAIAKLSRLANQQPCILTLSRSRSRNWRIELRPLSELLLSLTFVDVHIYICRQRSWRYTTWGRSSSRPYSPQVATLSPHPLPQPPAKHP